MNKLYEAYLIKSIVIKTLAPLKSTQIEEDTPIKVDVVTGLAYVKHYITKVERGEYVLVC